MLLLNFSKANAKLVKLQKTIGKKVYSFDTLSGGENCPYAKDCQSQVIYTENGFRIRDGKHTKFRCFSASQEALFPAARNSRLQNTQLKYVIATNPNLAIETILCQLPKKCEVLRIHVSGDFSTQADFDTWLAVANRRPDIIFYAYTKSLPFWIRRMNDIPANFRLTASFGGWKDELIDIYSLPYAKVVKDEEEAAAYNLPIDHDDSHAYNGGERFLLLVHGVQPKGSDYGKAVAKLNGVGSYNRKG